MEVRAATATDLGAIADLAELKRAWYARAEPELWRPSPAARVYHRGWLEACLASRDAQVRVASSNGAHVDGFAIWHQDARGERVVDDWAVRPEGERAGLALLGELARGSSRAHVVCGRADPTHARLLRAQGFERSESGRSLALRSGGAEPARVRPGRCGDAAALRLSGRQARAFEQALAEEHAVALVVERARRATGFALGQLVAPPPLYESAGPTLRVAELEPGRLNRSADGDALVAGLEAAGARAGAALLLVSCPREDADLAALLDVRGFRAAFDWYESPRTRATLAA